MQNKKEIYSTLIPEDAKHIISLLEQAGIKSESSNSLLNDHIYLNSASTKEYLIFVEEFNYIAAKDILEKEGIEVRDLVENEKKKVEVDYLHDSLRLAIFGMLFVPLALNLLSLFKLFRAITSGQNLKFFRVLQILIFNIIGISFWSIILYNKYYKSS